MPLYVMQLWAIFYWRVFLIGGAVQLFDFCFYLKKSTQPKAKGNVLQEAWGAKTVTGKNCRRVGRIWKVHCAF